MWSAKRLYSKNQCIHYTARQKKTETLVVTLLDLKNAFGEVSHSLIPTVLQFHHIPREIQNIISEFYSGLSTLIATKTFVTSPLQVEKGVLQGDCLSPLLFNMLSNTFIQTLTKSKKFDQLNYRYDNIIQPRNWFQFADDALAVASFEYENQILLNVFTRWCTQFCRIKGCGGAGAPPPIMFERL